MIALPEAVQRLADAVHRAGPDDLASLASQVSADLGALGMTVYLVDYAQTAFTPFAPPGSPPGELVAIDGTLAGQSYGTGTIQHAAIGGVYHVWAPLVDGAERLGVLYTVTAAAPDAVALTAYGTVAALLAEILVTRRRYGDAIERARRRLPMQLAAEIIWTQLPPLTFASRDVAVSAVLEPCYDVGGDAFDYAINDGVLHVAMFDAVGHGIAASATTSLALNAYRNARRLGLDLADTYRSIDKWVAAQHPDSFLTALLGELDTRTGVYRRISAGHPGELLLRDDVLVHLLPAPTAMPLGLGQLTDPIPDITETVLRPGDNLLLYTDGVVEARTAAGEFFGIERLAAFVARALADHHSTAETMRRLVHAILEHQHEQLQDDATAALLTFRPATA
ncbi:PP2C family protein-serine/threonine phosphatase [Dactylosporangium sp. CS-047395]|uniref:PP2C family protein-serine/threonine phosphatase n=1 Tax=Dactylosporangium sp. CS-047395 TaxID=3239936 RepID=UPI003D8F8B92